MKRHALCITLLAALAASNAAANLTNIPKWNGSWKAPTGDTMLLSEYQGVIDMSGIDSRSGYRAVCIVNKEDLWVATCAGHGVDHAAGGSRFIYRSTMRLNSEDRSINETWETEQQQGRTQGKTQFKAETANPANSSR